MIDDILTYEKKVVEKLNNKGWQLTHTGDSYLPYDAIGKTSNGFDCIIEMKFRDSYYEQKMLETYKYEKMMSYDGIKIYLVIDPKGIYFFILERLTDLVTSEIECPTTTYWDSSKKTKSVYLLSEKQADIIIKNVHIQR